MTVNYKQFVRAKISKKKFHQILRSFALDLTATQIAALISLNRNTVNRYLTLIRRSITLYCESESPFTGEIELDESYFGAKRVRGKRGRGACGKTIVFGVYKRWQSIYRDRSQLLSQNALRDHKGQGGGRFRYPYRRVSHLRRNSRSGLSEALSNKSFG